MMRVGFGTLGRTSLWIAVASLLTVVPWAARAQGTSHLHVELNDPLTWERIARGDPIAAIVNLGPESLPLNASLNRVDESGTTTFPLAEGTGPSVDVPPGALAWLSFEDSKDGLSPFEDPRGARWILTVALGTETKVFMLAIMDEPRSMPFLASQPAYSFAARPILPWNLDAQFQRRQPHFVIPVSVVTRLGVRVPECEALSFVNLDGTNPPVEIWPFVWADESVTTDPNRFRTLKEARAGCREVPRGARNEVEGVDAAVVLPPDTGLGRYETEIGFIGFGADLQPVRVSVTRHAPIFYAFLVLLLGIIVAGVLQNLVAVQPKYGKISKALDRFAELEDGESFTDADFYARTSEGIRDSLRESRRWYEPVTENANRLIHAENEVAELEAAWAVWNDVAPKTATLEQLRVDAEALVGTQYRPPGFPGTTPAWFASADALASADPSNLDRPSDLVDHYRQVVSTAQLAATWLDFHSGLPVTQAEVDTIYQSAVARAIRTERSEAVELKKTWNEAWHELWEAKDARDFARTMTEKDVERARRAKQRLAYLLDAAPVVEPTGSPLEGVFTLLGARRTWIVESSSLSVRRRAAELFRAEPLDRLAAGAFARVEDYVYRWGTWGTFFLAAGIAALAGLTDVYFGNAFFGSGASYVWAFTWGFGTKVTVDALGQLVAVAGKRFGVGLKAKPG